MMLLRTLVLERSGEEAPVNGALLCGFAVAQIESNFLVYSLDEEAEPGHSRVYIAALRKKLERYFLGGVDSKEDLQVAMQVFKQILMAASGAKTSGAGEAQTPFHFVDLKGCRLPPARPEDHHSVIIKKALVMKVITLGMSAPALPAIESNTVIVPNIRFSSQMVASPKEMSPPKTATQLPDKYTAEEPSHSVAAVPETFVPAGPGALPVEFEASEAAPAKRPAHQEHATLLEVDSTLANLARVVQELTQKKHAAIEREEMLEQWQVRLQHQQGQLDEKNREVEQRHRHLQEEALGVGRKAEKLTLMMSQLSAMRQRLHTTLLELDQVLEATEMN
ncbi:hypothetical protein EXW72_16860 [Pseudomonas sp. BCA14]|uniref:hypothetical protein n=1 Tax=unclassified Pseudomonas TaxID=196821 RepID=UPI00106E9139|nr:MULTISPECIES: hypothetical protein [unclassified Pseudomonas]TFF03996.1 hypothetical protein EXW70_23035 [Pseudomonas sp. JMN1]TFF08895.1 hypothetical protein EXW71_17120 [Pseudomonas sp. BCA17]TFF24568.1 hypothetical protein EXW72_16860 [Pseudomonas sp. BCA14]TFF29477.1 hypothetical protein EXW73_09725 [Pseudomonas sp. BCA13]